MQPSVSEISTQSSAKSGAAGRASNQQTNQQVNASTRNVFQTGQGNTSAQQTADAHNNSTRRSSVTQNNNAKSSVLRSGSNPAMNGGVGTPGALQAPLTQTNVPVHPPIPRAGQAPATIATETESRETGGASRPARYTAVPNEARTPGNTGAPGASRTVDGAMGISNTSKSVNSTRRQHDGNNINTQTQSSTSHEQNNSRHESVIPSTQNVSAQSGAKSGVSQPTHGVNRIENGALGTDNRRSSVPVNNTKGAAGSTSAIPTTTVTPPNSGAAGITPAKPANPATTANLGAAGKDNRRTSTAPISPTDHIPSQLPTALFTALCVTQRPQKARDNWSRAKGHFQEVKRQMPKERQRAAEQAQKTAQKTKTNAENMRTTADKAGETARDANTAVKDAKQHLKEVRQQGRQTLREVKQHIRFEQRGATPNAPNGAANGNPWRERFIKNRQHDITTRNTAKGEIHRPISGATDTAPQKGVKPPGQTNANPTRIPLVG